DLVRQILGHSGLGEPIATVRLETWRWRRALSQFKRADPSGEVETTRATASLPGLEIEIVHRSALGGDGEQLSIHLQAVPSFEAFGRYVEAANPFAFWSEMARLAWLPWLEAASTAMQPWSVPLLPKPGAEAARSPRPPASSG